MFTIRFCSPRIKPAIWFALGGPPQGIVKFEDFETALKYTKVFFAAYEVSQVGCNWIAKDQNDQYIIEFLKNDMIYHHCSPWKINLCSQ